MKNIIKEKNTLILLFVFLAMQPVLDIYILFSEDVVKIFRFSPSTIIRMVFVTFLLIVTLVQHKFNFKKEKYILIYLMSVLVYFVFHHYNCLKVKNDLPSTFRYSTITEIFYFIRMLIPFTLIYVLYKQKFKKEYFYKIISFVVLAFSVTIIVTNILNLSLTSYGGDRLIMDNIFGWFTDVGRSYGHELLASRGIFTSANQVSALLLMLLTITFYRMIKEPTKFNILVISLQILAMIMLGTRVASYGWIMVVPLVFICYLFFCFIKKEIKFNKNILIIIIMLSIPFTIIQVYSPIMFREYDLSEEFVVDLNKLEELPEPKSEVNEDDVEYAEADTTSEETVRETIATELNINTLREELNYYIENMDEANFILTEELEEFFKKSYSFFGINPGYIMRDVYSYKTDPVFWLQTMTLDYDEVVGNRNHDLLITKRIIGLNDNKNDKWLGIGFSTLRNGKIYLEQDFRVHSYSLGILGTILLLGPYFIVLCKVLFIMIANYKKKFNMETIILLLSIVLTITIAWLSGHIMDELIVTIFIALIYAMLLLNINEKDDGNAES